MEGKRGLLIIILLGMFFTFFPINIVSASSLNITYPLNSTNYSQSISNLNYTLSGSNLRSCWYSNNSGSWNSTAISAGTNWTGLNYTEGENIWTVYCSNVSAAPIGYYLNPVYDEGTGVNLWSYNFTINGQNATVGDKIIAYNQDGVVVGWETARFEGKYGYMAVDGVNGDIINFTIIDNETRLMYNITKTYTISGASMQYTTVEFDLGDVNFSSYYENYSRITFNVDTTLPVLTIAFPTTTLYNQNVTELNYTFTETNPSKCWYSNSSGAWNSSLVECGNNFTEINSSEGSNTWTLYMNDTYGNLNSTSITFTKDTVSPSSIAITYPANGSTYTNMTSINYTAFDSGNLSRCWYSNSSGAWNSSAVSAGTNFTNVIASEGINNFILYCNDTAGNWNSSNVLFTVDTITPPYFTTIPEDASLFYGNESLSKTFIATDVTGFGYYLIYNDTRFTINQTGFLSNATPMAVGDYQVNVTVNDTLGNINWTIYTVQIKKSNYFDCGIYFNATSPITFSDNFVVYTNCSSAYTLYINGTSISNASTINSGAGYYNLTVQRTDTANYTNVMNSRFFTVSKLTSVVKTYINNSQANLTLQSGTYVWLNGTLTTGILSGGSESLGLLVDESSQNSSNSSGVNSVYKYYTSFSNLGLHNVTTSYTGNQNYTEGSEIFNVTVIDTTSPTYSGVSTDKTVAGQTTEFSISVNDNYALQPNGRYIFSTNNTGEWINDTAVNFTTTPSWANVSKTLNSTVGTLVGYMWYLNDTNGNTNSTSVYVLITTAAPVSSGGGGGGSSSTTTYTVDSSFLSTGDTFDLGKSNKISFSSNGNSHSLTLKKFDSSSATVVIESNPITASLVKGITSSFDLNNDLVEDIRVRYDGIVKNKAVIFIQKIVPVITETGDVILTEDEATIDENVNNNEKIIIEENNINTETKENTNISPIDNSKIISFIKSKIFMFGVLVLLFVLISFLSMHKRKKRTAVYEYSPFY